MSVVALKLLLLCKILAACFGFLPDESTEQVSPCVNYYQYSCSQGQYTSLRETLNEDFNRKLNEEISLLPDCDAAFENVMMGKGRLEREDFSKELLKRCDDTNFLRTFRIMAYEEIDEIPTEGDFSCEEIASFIVDVVMRDDRESTSDLVDVVRKVRDFVALDNLREKDVLMSEAFRKSRKLFETIKQRYLNFINILYAYFNSGHDHALSNTDNHLRRPDILHMIPSTRDFPDKTTVEVYCMPIILRFNCDSYLRLVELKKSTTNLQPNIWYEKAETLTIEFPMRIKRFFTTGTLELFNNEYNYCLERILDMDSRERTFCFSRAWRIARGGIPLSRNMEEFVHNLKGLDVNERDGHVYVRPAYVMLLSNAFMSHDYADEPAIMGSLGFEIIREMTRASYDIPLNTRTCFRKERKIVGFTGNPMDEQEERNYIYNVVALRAIQMALPDSSDEKDLKLLLSVSPLIDCANEDTSLMLNYIFGRNTDFQKVFDCDETAAMVMPQEKCKLL